jgi:hypothetical protein
MGDIQACRNCAGTIDDTHQRTCPHCLEELRTRSFQRREDLERFREDRRAHGAPVHDDGQEGSNVISLLLGLAASVMIVAGGLVAFGGFASGSFAQGARALGQAVVPLAMGFGLFEMARRRGGASS